MKMEELKVPNWVDSFEQFLKESDEEAICYNCAETTKTDLLKYPLGYLLVDDGVYLDN